MNSKLYFVVVFEQVEAFAFDVFAIDSGAFFGVEVLECDLGTVLGIGLHERNSDNQH